MRALVFSGTSEGKEICHFLSEKSVETKVCVATDFGREVMEELKCVSVHIGRLQIEEMISLMHDYDIVIDATHPYATAVTENILEACSQTHTEYVRLLREDTFEDNNNSQVITVPDVKHAARYLKDNSEGKIFISTGSKELHEYKVIPDYKERIVARVLPVEDSIRKCEELGLKHTIYEKGPFDYEQNKAAFSKENAEWLVTKSGGKAGGFDEKLDAALELGMKVIVITRPEERTDGKSLEEVKLQISKMLRE